MKVMITGGAGYIGTHLTYKLLQKNSVDQIIIYDTLARKNTHVFKLWHLSDNKKVSLMNNDINDYWALKNALDYFAPTHIVHLSGLVDADQSVIYPEEYYKQNTIAVEKLMRAIEEQKTVENLIFSSSAAVYGDNDKKVGENAPLHPVNPYGTSKKIAESIIRGSNIVQHRDLQSTILRFFNVAGYYRPLIDSSRLAEERSVIPKMVRALKTHEPFHIRNKNCVRDYVDIDDVCNVISKCLETWQLDYPSVTMNVCSGIGTSLETLIKEFQTATKSNLITKPSKRSKENLIMTSIGDPSTLLNYTGYSCTANIEKMIKSNLFSE